MRIMIDALATLGGGGETYLRGLLPALGDADQDSEFWVLRAPWQQFWDFALPANVTLVNVPALKDRAVPRRVFWQQAMFPDFVRKQHIDVLFCPTDTITLAAPCKTVLTIQNFNPYLGGALQRGLRYYISRKIVLRSATWISARKAANVIFVSDYSRRIVCRQLGIPLDKAAVVHHGLAQVFSNSQLEVPDWLNHIPRPYLLSISAIMGHKNYPFLVRAFVALVQRHNIPHHLVIAGPQLFQEHVQQMQQIAQQAGLEDRLHLLGAVAQSELPALYQQAELFIFPSLLEVFGFPLIEAMASGVPVVASDATSSPELCGEAAVYFDPTDIGDAVEKICQALRDDPLRERLAANGLARAADFSWEKTAKKTVAVLKSVI